MLRDFRHAWRGLLSRSNRAFTLATVLTFALGIGAATAIFSVVQAMLLAPLPYQDESRVLRAFDSNPSRGMPEFAVSIPNFLSWQQRASGFEALAALTADSANLGDAGQVERVPAIRASSTLWRVLGQPLVAGREFTAEEDRPGAARVAILGEGIWRTRYGADPSLVGRTLTIDGVAHAIVGIARQDVGFATDVGLWLPLAPDPSIYGRGDRRLDVLGRLAAGTTPAQAQAAMDTLSASLAAEFPESNAGWQAVLQPVREWIVGPEVRARLYGMLAAVALLMLVACTNVANLQIARASARQRELGVRQALGAARGRLVSHLLAECTLLALLGGVLGVALAWAAVQAAIAALPAATPRLAAFALDWRAAALAIGVSAATAFAFGVTPALLAMRTQLAAVLQQLGRSAAGARRGPLRQILVVLQFALATLLVCAAALLAQHLATLQKTALGFPVENLLIARITQAQENENVDLTPHYLVHERLLEAIRALPGVAGVGLASEIPLGDVNTTSMTVAPGAGGALTYRDASTQAAWRVISPDYLATLGVPLLSGRYFAPNESPRSAVISRGLSQTLWPGESDVVGRTFRLGNGQQRTVVGVVADVRQIGLGEAPTPTMYLPTTWLLTPTMTLVVRSQGDPAALMPAIRDAALRAAPAHPLFDLQAMHSVIGTRVAEPRVQTSVLFAFGVASLLLAAFGAAGVVAYLVANRTPELAVRMALGAAPARLVAQVVRSGVGLCLTGIALGALALTGLAQLRDRLAPMLGEVEGGDPLAMLAAAAAVLLAVGALACWVPARRVGAIAPNAALRDGG